VGKNAQGKTSFLEAIYLFSTFTSFHAENDRQIINFLAGRESLSVARIVADFVRGKKNHKMEIRIIQERNGYSKSPRVRKEIFLDGVKQKIGEAIGVFNAVLFLPQMLQVIDGSPDSRRRYLNLTLSQVMPGYATALAGYNRLLPQRNALLKQLSESGGDISQLQYWDQQVSLLGSQLIYARILAVKELELLAGKIHQNLTRGQEVLRLDYQPSFDPLPTPEGQIALSLDDPRDRSSFSIDQIQKGFLSALIQKRAEEIVRGVTTIGPHRDELRFMSNGIDLGSFGSRGQVRTTLLTLKLAEVTWMREKTGHWPVLLLDEVLAELDEDRRKDLLAQVLQSEQALLTTTELDMFTDKFLDQAQIWKITSGRVETSV